MFLLPAFIRLGHECQEVLCPYDGMHRLDLGSYSVHTLIRKSFRATESEPTLTPKEKSPLPEAQRRFEPATLHYAGQQTQHTIPTELTYFTTIAF